MTLRNLSQQLSADKFLGAHKLSWLISIPLAILYFKFGQFSPFWLADKIALSLSGATPETKDPAVLAAYGTYFGNLQVVFQLVWVAIWFGFFWLTNYEMQRSRAKPIHFIGGLVVFALINLVATNLLAPTGETSNQAATADLVAYASLALLLKAAVIAPVVEELFYRRFLQGVVFTGWLGVLISGFSFAYAHVQSLSEIWVYVPAGLTLAFLFKRYGSFWLGVFVHVTWNSLSNFL